MTPNEREWIVVKVAEGGVTEFRTAVISVGDDILARIVKHGSVERSTSATTGPSMRPELPTRWIRGGPSHDRQIRKDYHLLLVQGRQRPLDGGLQHRLDPGQQRL
jgi:hypothetical protein